MQTSAFHTPGPSGEAALRAHADALRRDCAQHKRAIRLHREQLAVKTSSLRELEARCRALGIRVMVQE